MDEFLDAVGAVVCGLLIFVAIMVFVYVPLALLEGLVLRDLWGWFIVPLGVPSIGVIHAFGIMIVMGVFHRGIARSKAKSEKTGDTIAHLISLIAGILLAWLVGYVAYCYM